MNEIDFATLRQDRSLLEAELRAAGAELRDGATSCRCPWHDDRSASGSIHQGPDGGWRYKCHCVSCDAGGDFLDLRARNTGRTRAEEVRLLSGPAAAGFSLQAERPAARKVDKPKPVYTRERLVPAAEWSDQGNGGRLRKCYTYRDAVGAVALLVLRLERPDGTKSFRQARPAPGGYVLEAPAKPWPLYNLAAVLQAGEVVLTEGEKCADAVNGIGLVATTSAAGAGKSSCSDWRPLAGKVVYLWSDNDEPGIRHMREVSELLRRLPTPPKSLRWVESSALGLPAKGDAADFIRDHSEGPAEWVREVLDRALPVELAGLHAMLEDEAEGRRVCIDWAFPLLTANTQSLLPGMATLLAGSPGATKSLWLMQNIRHWVRHGVPCAVLELEYGQTVHVRRAFAQEAKNANLTNPKWVKLNREATFAAEREHADFMSKVARAVFDPGDADPTPDWLVRWVSERADAGARVICVDPSTLMAYGPRSWQDDANFLRGAKRACERAAASLVVVSHPRKMPHGSRGAQSMDDIAGGAAYMRGCQTMLFLKEVAEATVTLAREHNTAKLLCNRTLAVWKANHAPWTKGTRLAYYFDSQTLESAECGVLPRKKQEADEDEE